MFGENERLEKLNKEKLQNEKAQALADDRTHASGLGDAYDRQRQYL